LPRDPVVTLLPNFLVRSRAPQDTTGRVPLSCRNGSLAVRALATGLVVAVAGTLSATGHLDVEKWCPPGPPPPAADTASVAAAAAAGGGASGGEPTYLLLVSGLRAGGAHDGLPSAMLADFVSGHLGCPADVKLASRIARVVLCGDSRAPVDPALLAAGGKLSKQVLQTRSRMGVCATACS